MSSNNQKMFQETRIYLTIWFTIVTITSIDYIVNDIGPFMITLHLLLSSVGNISCFFQKYDYIRLASFVGHVLVGVALPIYGVVDHMNNFGAKGHNYIHNYGTTVSIVYLTLTAVSVPIFWKHYTSSKALKIELNELNETTADKSEMV